MLNKTWMLLYTLARLKSPVEMNKLGSSKLSRWGQEGGSEETKGKLKQEEQLSLKVYERYRKGGHFVRPRVSQGISHPRTQHTPLHSKVSEVLSYSMELVSWALASTKYWPLAPVYLLSTQTRVCFLFQLT
jgi:hypothetical protein